MRVSLTQYNNEEILLFQFPFNPVLTRKIKQLPNPQWHPELAGWGVAWSPLAAWLCRRLFPDQSEYAPDVYDRILLEPVFTDSDPALPLYPFQHDGVRFLSQGNAVLHDCPGAGKSRQAIAAAKGPTIILCPVSVIHHWEWEIYELYPDRSTQIVRGKKEPLDQIDYSCPACTIPDGVPTGYWILSPGLLAARVNDLIALGAQSLIVDEIHEYRNPGAKKTLSLLALATRVPNVIGLSGTLVFNRVADLFAPFVAVKKIRYDNYWFFTERYCGGKKTKRPGHFANIEANSLQREDELREFISGFILRRTREDLGRDLPPLTRTVLDVELEEPTQYKHTEAEVAQWLRECGTAAPPETQMIKMNRLRRVGAIGKVAAVAPMIQDLLNTGEKVVVLCSFLEPLRMLQRLIPESFRIDGGVTVKNRKACMSLFQRTPTPLVALCSTLAGGVGITLTAARYAFILDLPWCPATLEQAEARIYRETQTRPCTIHYVLGRETIDRSMLSLLQKKARWNERLFNGGEHPWTDPLAELAQALTAQPISVNNPVPVVIPTPGITMPDWAFSVGSA